MEEKKEEQKRYKINNPLEQMLEKKVQIITTGGRVLVGILRGVDHTLNCVIQDCEERIYSKDAGVEFQKIGLYMIRGDNVATMGQIDTEIESSINFDNMRADPIPSVTNQL